MPAAVKKHTGRGSARITRSLRHGAILTASNSSGYTALQRHVDATVPALRRRLRTLSRRRARNKLAPRLRTA
ncbi:MAG: hypothetical protein IJF59_03400 [Clostridia bacterium]|nr:hypothetical protein [Clostridia bacterium]